MATQSTSVRVGVNFASSVDWLQAYLTVDTNDLIVAKWQFLRPDIIGVIRELPWAVLSVVRGSYGSPPKIDPVSNTLILDSFEPPEPAPENNPIILVGAPAESQASWQAMAEQIYSLCSNAGLGHCRVLFEPVQYPLTATVESIESLPGRLLCDEELAEDVPIGSSFGPIKDVQVSASMGGTIKLQGSDEEPSALLLSVFHPFEELVNEGKLDSRFSNPHISDSSQPNIYTDGLQNGWRHDENEPIKLKMPSVQDETKTRSIRQRGIEIAREMLELNSQKIDISPEKRAQSAARWQQALDNHEVSLKKLEDCTSGNQGLGYLQYGSGFKGGLDWSLSSFNDRHINNALPAMKDVEFAMRRAGLEDDPALLKYGGLSTEATIGRAEANSHVMKRGRSTGLTVGKVNTLPSDILVSKRFNLSKDIGIEVCAILNQGDGFAKNGDSGAWVLNLDGSWIGSVVGLHTPVIGGNLVPVALAIEAEKIVADIESFIGKRVVSPMRGAIESTQNTYSCK
jgi:hypothetical protein